MSGECSWEFVIKKIIAPRLFIEAEHLYRNVAMEGIIITRGEPAPGPTFAGRSICLVFKAPPSEQALTQIAAAEGVASICGRLLILKDAKRVIDEDYVRDPFEALIFVSAKAFDVILEKVKSALAERRWPSGQLTVKGASVPSTLAYTSPLVDEFDLSKNKAYAISSVEIIDDYNERPLPIGVRFRLPDQRSGERCTSLEIDIEAAVVHASFAAGVERNIRLAGKLTKLAGSREEITAHVNFKPIAWEYPPQGRGLPAEAVAGDYIFHPRSPEGSAPSFSIELSYSPQHLKEIEASLVGASGSKAFRMLFAIDRSVSDLEAATDLVRGKVWSYEFATWRDYVPPSTG